MIFLHEHIKALIAQITPPATTPKIVVGFSGGADSVFLLHHLVLISQQIPLELIAAHLNHGWRGDADISNEQFCRTVAAQLNVPFVTAHAQEIVITQRWNGSQEELGRNQRRAFLQQTVIQTAAHGIALGHQAQDQEELFFIRLFRGTTLEGLCGMESRTGNIIRPLLSLHRTEIEEWLTASGHTWQHDSDNDNRRFLRNRIRHKLLPLLHTMEPRFAATFARTHALLQEEQALLSELIKQEFEKIFSPELVGDLTAFKKITPMLQRHLFKNLCQSTGTPFPGSEGLIEEALRFINNPRGGSHQLWQGWALMKKENRLWISCQL